MQTLSKAKWARILPLLRSHPRIHTRDARALKRFWGALLWILRTGAQWRALPAAFGKWNSIYKRFRSWSRLGVFDRLMDAFAHSEADIEWWSVDSTVVRAHACAAGAPGSAGGQDAQALGRSRGGFSTKIHVKVDALGNPLKVALTAGQRNDKIGWDLLQDPRDAQADAALADRGYDSNKIREYLRDLGVEAVIPSTRSRKEPIEYDKELYKARHVVECFIGKFKWERRLAMRFDKLDEAFLGFLQLACVMIWLK